jgi:hypothetical protein
LPIPGLPTVFPVSPCCTVTCYMVSSITLITSWVLCVRRFLTPPISSFRMRLTWEVMFTVPIPWSARRGNRVARLPVVFP